MPITRFGGTQSPADNGSSTATQITLTPPGSMRAGDLVVVTLQQRGTATFSVGVTGGQTWNSTTRRTYTNGAVQTFYCTFNGSWDANPRFDFSAGTCTTAVMHVFRATDSGKEIALHIDETTNTFVAGTTPFTKTATGHTTTEAETVSLACFYTADDNTWGSLSGTGWVQTGMSAQYRNTAGSDQSMAFAYKIQSSAGATDNVSLNQATLGGDAGRWTMITFYERPITQTLTLPALTNDGGELYEPSLSPQQILTLPYLGQVSGIVQVQKKTYASTADSTTHNIVLDSAPIEGNTLMLLLSCGTSGITITGWTLVTEAVGFVKGSIYRKTAGASESATITITLDTAYNISVVVLEYDGLTGLVDQSGSQAGQGTGGITTPDITTTVADALLVAVAAYRDETVSVTSWNNSFVEDAESGLSSGSGDAEVGVSVGLREVASTGTYNSTATVAGTSLDQDVGAIAAFPKEQQTHGNVLFLPEITQGSAATNLTVPLLTNDNTLYNHTVVPGSVSITAPLFTNSNDLFNHTIVPQAVSLTVPILNNTNSLYEPTIILGSVTITAPVLSNNNTLYNHTVATEAVSILPPVINNTSVLYEFSVPASIIAPLLSNTSSVYNPTILPGSVSLSVPILTNTSALYNPTLTVGSVSLTFNLHNNTTTLYQPTITVGFVSLSVPLFTNTNTLNNHTVAAGAVSITAPLLTNGNTLYSPSLGKELRVPLLTNTSLLYEPTITTGPVTVSIPLIANNSTLFSHTIVVGAANLELPLITNNSSFFIHTVVQGSVSINAPILNNSSSLYEPTIVPQSVTLQVGLLTNNSNLFEPTITAGAVSLQVGLLTNTNSLFVPEISAGSINLIFDLFTNSNNLYNPTVTVGGASIVAPIITNTNTIYNSSIVVGPVDLNFNRLDNISEFFTHQILTISNVEVNLIDNISDIFSPVIELGNINLELPLISNIQTFYSFELLLPFQIVEFPILINNNNVFGGHYIVVDSEIFVYLGNKWVKGEIYLYSGGSWIKQKIKIYNDQNVWQ